MMASGSSKKKAGARSQAPVIRQRQGLPWLTIGAVAIVVALAAGITVFVLNQRADRQALAAWSPGENNHDPSVNIPGIYIGASVDPATDPEGVYSYPAYKAALHVTADQRVAYDRFPPVGGPHDGTWANCEGTVYSQAVRDENMVHTLEHGAVWITYNPDTVSADELDTLKGYVQGEGYISLSPYPGLTTKVSLQAWAHQLQVDSVTDPRIEQFIEALRRNKYVYPETGATCSTTNTGFDTANPPAFDATPRTKDDVQMDGAGAVPATNEPELSSMGVSTEVSGSVSGSASSGGASTSGSAAESTPAESTPAGSTNSGSSDTATTGSGTTDSATTGSDQSTTSSGSSTTSSS